MGGGSHAVPSSLGPQLLSVCHIATGSSVLVWLPSGFGALVSGERPTGRLITGGYDVASLSTTSQHGQSPQRRVPTGRASQTTIDTRRGPDLVLPRFGPNGPPTFGTSSRVVARLESSGLAADGPPSTVGQHRDDLESLDRRLSAIERAGPRTGDRCQ